MDTHLALLIPSTITALFWLLAPQWQIRRIEARMRDGDDRYLDEQRSYRAYPWQRNAGALRLMGAAILLMEAVYLGTRLLMP